MSCNNYVPVFSFSFFSADKAHHFIFWRKNECVFSVFFVQKTKTNFQSASNAHHHDVTLLFVNSPRCRKQNEMHNDCPVSSSWYTADGHCNRLHVFHARSVNWQHDLVDLGQEQVGDKSQMTTATQVCPGSCEAQTHSNMFLYMVRFVSTDWHNP